MYSIALSQTVESGTWSRSSYTMYLLAGLPLLCSCYVDLAVLHVVCDLFVCPCPGLGCSAGRAGWLHVWFLQCCSIAQPIALCPNRFARACYAPLVCPRGNGACDHLPGERTVRPRGQIRHHTVYGADMRIAIARLFEIRARVAASHHMLVDCRYQVLTNLPVYYIAWDLHNFTLMLEIVK